MNFETWFETRHPAIPQAGAAAVLKLATEGATVPFMARYRKEQTGNLDEVAIQDTLDAKTLWDETVKRQAFILGEIERQKKLTPELKEKIEAAFDLPVLEDLYLPFKQKRKTKATLAKEAGLEPLADWIWNCGHGTDTPLPGQTLELWAFTFRNPEKDVNDVEAVLQGAQDILTERLAETADLRARVREAAFSKGCVITKKAEKAKPHSKYDRYFDFHEAVPSLVKPENSHRYLALRRGWTEEELTLSIGGPPNDPEFEDRLQKAFEAVACTVPDSPGAEVLMRAAKLALKTHVLPAIDNEVHRALKTVADDAAIKVFAENVRQLLLSSPYGSKAVLGVDPGLRTGCKLAIVDQSGKFVASNVLRLQTEEGRASAKKLLSEILAAAEIRAVAVGNGTAGRETEQFLRTTLRELERPVPVVMVNESGASVYSASAAAREEFPELDVTVRGAISIARRLQDPLAELVKIDPKSIGVGQYQHDVSPSLLKKSLELVVDSCVNGVGVNLNTASYHLLAHVSGIGPSLAKGIVEQREKSGLFRSRQQLLEVPRFSKKCFEQAAGFLRIAGGDHPLDNTGVHPERYPALEGLARRLEKDVSDLLGPGVALVKAAPDLRDEVGAFTWNDIVRELEKPGRDPRDEFVPFEYREDIHEVKDLKAGMVCPGVVTNVTNFGAFVDVGVHQDGLVHLSQISDRFVKDPREVIKPGDRVKVRVLAVDLDKNQISLSMKKDPAEAKQEKAARTARDKERSRKTAGGPKGQPPRGPRPGPTRPEHPRPTSERLRPTSESPKPADRRPPGPPTRPTSPGKPPAPTEARRGSTGRDAGRPPRPQTAGEKPRTGPKPSTPSFNNPFASLANLRDTLKRGR